MSNQGVSSPVFDRPDGSNIIGADEEAVKDLIFLCNPYQRKCLFGDSKYGSYVTVLLI